MDINEYIKFYQIPIGTKVVIKECHHNPLIVGKVGFVAGWVDVEKLNYPLMVMLDEPIYIPVEGSPMAVAFQGPHFCRPDELTVMGEIPGYLKKAFEEEDKKEGTDGKV